MIMRIIFTLTLLLTAQAALTDTLTAAGATEIDAAIEKLDGINHLPSLLPVIIANSDFIGLTDEQLAELENLRNSYRQPILEAMSKIAARRIEIRESALKPSVSSARLQQLQNEMFRLHREVLEYKLSCRDRIIGTFNDENWASFYMVLSASDIGIQVPVSYALKR